MLLLLLLVAGASLAAYFLLDPAVGVFIASTYLALLVSAPLVALLPMAMVLVQVALFGAVLLRRYPHAVDTLRQALVPLRKQHAWLDTLATRTEHVFCATPCAEATWYARVFCGLRARVTRNAARTAQSVLARDTVDWLYQRLYAPAPAPLRE